MLRTLRLFVAVNLFHVATCYADMYVIDSPITMDVFPIYSDTRIAAGIDVSANLIKIERTLLIENYGMINSNIAVGDNLTFYFRNSGNFSGDVILKDNASLVQVIKSDSDMVPLDISANYSVMTYDGNNLSLGRLINTAAGADKIIFYDSRFVLDDAYFVATHDFTDMPGVELHGENIIYIDDYTDILNAPLLHNVSGTGAIHVYSDNLDALHMLTANVSNGNLFVRLERITDYARILGDSVGVFLNSVRDINPDDSLLRALDRADTMDGLHKILRRATSVHPILFMRYVDVIDSINKISAFDFADSFKMSVEPMRIFSDNLDAYGLRLNFDGIKFSDINIAVSAYGAVADIADDINEFSAISYGANIRAGYIFANRMFVRGMGGFSVAHFETGPVFDGVGITYNPVGKSIYAVADFGMKFDVIDGFSLAPFIGFDVRRFDILHENDFVASARIGADIKYSFEIAGLRYDYSGAVLSDHNGNIGAALRIGAWSVFDDVGGDASVAVINDEFAGRTYKLAISGRFIF